MPEDKELAKNIADFVTFLRQSNDRADIPSLEVIQSLYYDHWHMLLTIGQVSEGLRIAIRDGMLTC